MRGIEMSAAEKAVALGLALCAAVALALAVAAPAPAATYSNGFQLSKFKVEIKGWQNVTWHNAHEAVNECDVSNHSFGRERTTFRTAKPAYITATHMPGEFNPQLFGGRQLGIPTVAKVERTYTPVIGTVPDECAVAGGDGTGPTPPDCGAKTIKPWKLELQYARKQKNALILSGNGEQDPYEVCPGASVEGFPWLVVEKGVGYKGRYISAELSQDELFDPKVGKWITIADGTHKTVSRDYRTQTRVHWEVSFTRLKEKVANR